MSITMEQKKKFNGPEITDVAFVHKNLKKVFDPLQHCNLKIMTTNKCNLSCSYCPQQHSLDSARWNTTTLDTLHEAFKQLDRESVWDWFGGEPLIHKKTILEFMERNKENLGDNIQYHITTNGTLLTEEFVEQYMSYKNTTIVVSIDTVIPVENGRDVTDPQIKHILTMLNCIASKGNPYLTTVGMTVGRTEAKHIDQTMRVLNKLGVKNMMITPLLFSRTTGCEEWTPEEMNEVGEKITNTLKEMPDVIAEFGAETVDKSTTNCFNGERMVAIDGSGDVSGCIFFSNNKSIFGDTIITNVLTGYRNLNFNDRQNIIDTMYASEKCSSCDYNNLCHTCPAGNVLINPTSFEPHPVCQDIITQHLKVAEQSDNNQTYRDEIIAKFCE